jgi:hypothetical protein
MPRMRRFARHLFTLGSGVSLLLCVAAGVLWVRSYDHAQRWGRAIGSRRYTATSALGTVVLAVPPQPPADPALRRRVEQLLADVRLDQFFWVIYPKGKGRCYASEVEPFPGSAAYIAVRNFKSADLVPTLAAALDDPDRLPVAHLLLTLKLRPPNQQFYTAAVAPGGGRFARHDCQWDEQDGHSTLPWVRVNEGGLTFTLNAWVEGDEFSRARINANKDMDFHPVTGDADPSNAALVRDLWRRRLDATLATIAWKHLFLATLALPGLWLALRTGEVAKRASARRHHRCVACGYDLRATPERCPECGTLSSSKANA